MRFPKTCKVGAVAPKNDRYYATNSAWLDTENKVLVETDGKVLSVLPVELDDEDTTGPVSLDAIKVALRGSKHKPAIVRCNGGLEVPEHGQTFAREDAAGTRFPDYRKVLPAKGAGSTVIGLDAVLLARIAKSLGSDVLFLEISAPNVVVRVDAKDGDGYGAIMPVSE